MWIVLLYISLILVGISVFIITSAVFIDEGQYKASEKLDDNVGKDKIAQQGVILRYSRPFFRRYVVPIVSNMKQRGKIRNKYKRKLAMSGLTVIISPEEFYSFKLFLIIGFPILFIGVKLLADADWPMTTMIPLAFFGFVYPDLWLSGKIKQRQEDIITNMPFAIDMLALCVEAGLDFVAAMAKVVEKARRSSLSEEFEMLMKEITVGASRAEALRNLSWRVGLINITSFCATLIAADSVGASIGPILKALAIEIRQKRSNEVEKKAAKAATKILFPMMIFIVPAVFIIVATPLALEFMLAKK